jgi:hypothetical protein
MRFDKLNNRIFLDSKGLIKNFIIVGPELHILFDPVNDFTSTIFRHIRWFRIKFGLYLLIVVFIYGMSRLRVVRLANYLNL